MCRFRSSAKQRFKSQAGPHAARMVLTTKICRYRGMRGKGAATMAARPGRSHAQRLMPAHLHDQHPDRKRADVARSAMQLRAPHGAIKPRIAHGAPRARDRCRCHRWACRLRNWHPVRLRRPCRATFPRGRR